MKENKYENMVLITEKGVISGSKNPADVLARILFAYLSIWNDEIFEIDMEKAADKIVGAMKSLRKNKDGELEGQMSFEDILDMLFAGDDEDGKT